MNIEDENLQFLAELSNEELTPLVDVLLDSDHKGRFSSELDMSPRFKAHYPNHSEYLPEIVSEIQKYGGNTLANLLRGGVGVSYREILCDVCEHLKVNFNKCQSIQMIEDSLLSKVLTEVWEKMSYEERKAVLADTGCNVHSVGGVTSATMITLFRKGGFSSYKLTMIIINAVWRAIFGRGLSLAANRAICKFLSVLTGPIGWALTGVWTAVDIASPAMRVTVPAVIYIAGMRRVKGVEEDLKKLNLAEVSNSHIVGDQGEYGNDMSEGVEK